MVVMECQWSVPSKVYFESGIGVAIECESEAALEFVTNMRINIAMTPGSGNCVLRPRWQYSVYFVAIPVKLSK